MKRKVNQSLVEMAINLFYYFARLQYPFSVGNRNIFKFNQEIFKLYIILS